MKTFVLMHKVTAELFEGARVSLYDRNVELTNQTTAYSFGLKTFVVDGFLVYHHDKMSEFYWYVNNQEMEKHFEVISEL